MLPVTAAPAGWFKTVEQQCIHNIVRDDKPPTNPRHPNLIMRLYISALHSCLVKPPCGFHSFNHLKAIERDYIFGGSTNITSDRVSVLYLKHPQRDFEPPEASAAGCAAARPQGPHGLWSVNFKGGEMNETVDYVLLMQIYNTANLRM